MEHEIGAVGRVCSKKPLTKPAANRNHEGRQDNEDIAQDPQCTDAGAFALGVRPLDRNVLRPQVVAAVGRQALQKSGGCHGCPAHALEAAKVPLTLCPSREPNYINCLSDAVTSQVLEPITTDCSMGDRLGCPRANRKELRQARRSKRKSRCNESPEEFRL